MAATRGPASASPSGLAGAVVQGGEDPARRGRLAARENPRQLGKRRDGIADGHPVGGARCGRLSHRHPPRCARSESRPLPNLSHDDAPRSHAPGAHRGQLPMRPAPRQVARPDATSRRDVWGREETGGIRRSRHSCAAMRCHARRLNPLARGVLRKAGWEFPPTTEVRANAPTAGGGQRVSVVHGLSTRPTGLAPVRRTRPQFHRTPRRTAALRAQGSCSALGASATKEPSDSYSASVHGPAPSGNTSSSSASIRRSMSPSATA